MSHRLISASAAVLVLGTIGATVATRPKAHHQTPPTLIVRLELTADGQPIARLSTPTGTMATMAVEGGEEVGLTPEAEGDHVGLAVSVKDRVTAAFVTIGRFTLRRDQPADVSTERTRLQVEWIGTVELAAPAGSAATPKGPCTTCCIICEGRTICACEVESPCGYCCCPTHCFCSGGSPQRPRARGSQGRGVAGAPGCRAAAT